MTRLKTMHKLANAVRAKRGRLVNTPKGPRPLYRDLAPRKDQAAQDRIDRWKFRCQQKGIKVQGL